MKPFPLPFSYLSHISLIEQNLHLLKTKWLCRIYFPRHDSACLMQDKCHLLLSYNTLHYLCQIFFVFCIILRYTLVFFLVLLRVSVALNFVYRINSLHQKYSDYHFDFENYIRMIIGKNELVNVFYYNASLKQEVNARRFKEQQKLLARLRKIPKYNVILCKRQKRFGKDNEEYYTIKGDDIYRII